MSYTPKILAFAGSTRRDSFNKKLVKVAAQGARAAQAEVTVIDLADFPMPLYDGDLEAKEGLPSNARKLKELMIAHQGFLISSPEYNSSVTGVLKNAIDWTSRKSSADEPALICFTNKTAGLMSASPGGLGGLRSLIHLRAILENIGTIVLPYQVAVPKAGESFNPDGTLKDVKQKENIEKIGANLAKFLMKMNG
jgi:NAD(P)H-dependent FMN reductase